MAAHISQILKYAMEIDMTTANQYYDQLHKVKLYKDMVTQALVKQGEFPSKDTVENIVSRIDLRYSVLDHQTINANDSFDTEQWNQELYLLYSDILILYKTLFVNELEEYTKIKSMVDGYISSLEELASRCDSLTKMHIESTSLGNTIYFQSSGFEIITDELSTSNSVSVRLPADIMSYPEARLIYNIRGTGFYPDESYLDITQKNFTSVYLPEYSKNGDYYKVPGEIKEKVYYYNTDNSVIGSYMFVLPSSLIEANNNNTYKCFAGKNKISVLSNNNASYESYEKHSNSSLVIPADSTVKFYIKNGTYINFDFSAKPKRKNFNGYELINPEPLTEISFTTSGSIMFNFDTDGEIWAEKVNTSINNSSIVIANHSNSTDFMIIERVYADKVSISNNISILAHIPIEDYSNFHIDSISIKELSGGKA